MQRTELEASESKSIRRACLSGLVVAYAFVAWLAYLNYVIVVVAHIIGYASTVLAPRWVRAAGVLFTLCALCASLLLCRSNAARVHAVGKLAAPLLLTAAAALCLVPLCAGVSVVIAMVVLTAVAIFFSSAVICHQMRPLLRMSQGAVWLFLDMLLLDLAVMVNLKLSEQTSVQLIMLFGMVPTVMASFDPAAMLIDTTMFKRQVCAKFGTAEPYVCAQRRIYIPGLQIDKNKSADAWQEDPMQERDSQLTGETLKLGTAACACPFSVVLVLFAVDYKCIVETVVPTLGLGCVQAAAGVSLGFTLLELTGRNRYILIAACGVMSLAAFACVACALLSVLVTSVVLIIGTIFGAMLIAHGMTILNDPRRADDERQLGFFLVMLALLLLTCGHQLTTIRY
ncbi:envelope protein UL43 [Psittacid alphaherpesvirus 1]|nr:envelope protein UL43 [Psittacid alphaherpesvirus 1]